MTVPMFGDMVERVLSGRLLDVLAGRTEQTGIEGHILVDGRRRPKNFKLMTGYVVQVTLHHS